MHIFTLVYFKSEKKIKRKASDLAMFKEIKSFPKKVQYISKYSTLLSFGTYLTKCNLRFSDCP